MSEAPNGAPHGAPPGAPIKTPGQLIAAVIAGFAVPIAIIVLLATYVDNTTRTGAGTDELSSTEVARRIETCWRPYRECVAARIDEAVRRHGKCWHLDLHSMPSNVYERLGMAPRPAADIVLGDRQGTTCDPAFTRLVRRAFQRGFSAARTARSAVRSAGSHLTDSRSARSSQRSWSWSEPGRGVPSTTAPS